jgi:hypothetical protein
MMEDGGAIGSFCVGKRRVDVDVEELKRWWKKEEGGP